MSNDAVILGRVLQACVGKCRICGCTDDARCRIYTGEECMWFDKLRTLCTNPDCIATAERQKKEKKRMEQRRERDYVPLWMREKKSGVVKRRRRKVRGRAA